MKVSASLVILAGVIEAKSDRFRAPKGFDENGNKINGQHPKRRLQALNKFMCNWAETYLDDGTSERFCKRYTDMIYRLDKSFERPQCAFFDPSVRFGGPNPDEGMRGLVPAKNPNAKNPHRGRRLKRSDDDVDACDGKTESECDSEAMDGLDCSEEDRADPSMADFCEDDGTDSDGNIVRGKMSTPNRKLKRYSTGLAKWCNRYISECYGQRVHAHCVERAKHFLSTLQIDDESS
jgi:hypothetical protein